MNIKAIVYTSNTGYTAEYARLLGEKTGLPVYSLEESKHNLAERTEIVYLGWLMASMVKGYGEASKLYNISLVCGVCELGSNLLCAFWLIPSFGIIGRNLSYPLGYWIAALFLLISYPLLRKRIYAPAKQTQNA